MNLKTIALLLSGSIALVGCKGENSAEEMESAIDLYLATVPFEGDGFVNVKKILLRKA